MSNEPTELSANKWAIGSVHVRPPSMTRCDSEEMNFRWNKVRMKCTPNKHQLTTGKWLVEGHSTTRRNSTFKCIPIFSSGVLLLTQLELVVFAFFRRMCTEYWIERFRNRYFFFIRFATHFNLDSMPFLPFSLEFAAIFVTPTPSKVGIAVGFPFIFQWNHYENGMNSCSRPWKLTFLHWKCIPKLVLPSHFSRKIVIALSQIEIGGGCHQH